MKILYMHQYFVIPSQAGGTRSYWVALEFLKNKHTVVMLTSRNTQRNLIEQEVIDGIKVIFIRNSYSNSMSVSKRLVSFIRFMVISSIVALREKKVDLVYATSTPLTIGFPALLLRFFKMTPFIFEVRDLWPEFPIQIGAVKSKTIIYFLRLFEKRIYRKAKHIVALSPGMKDGIVSTGINLEKISVVPNMSKIDIFFPHEPDIRVMKRFKISPEKFKVIHFGAMGPANGLNYLIEAARIMNEHDCIDVEIILLGDGKEKIKLQNEVKSSNLYNYIKFIDSQPVYITSEIVNCCECSIVTVKNLPVMESNSANKLFDTLSAGKPVLINYAGWTKNLVESNKIGIFLDPNNPGELLDAILLLKNNKNLAKVMGENARMLAETKFDKSLLCKELVQVVEEFS